MSQDYELQKNEEEKKKKNLALRWLDEHLFWTQIEQAKKIKDAFRALDSKNFNEALRLFRELLNHTDLSAHLRARILAGLALAEYSKDGFNKDSREHFFTSAITDADVLEQLLAYYAKKFKDAQLQLLIRTYVRERASQDVH